MPWIAIGSAVIGAYGSMKGAGAQADAAKQSAQWAANASAEDIAFNKKIFEQQQKDQEPFMATGREALGQYQAGVASGDLSYTPSEFDYENAPGYEFRQDELNRGINNAFAARGLTGSGASLRQSARVNQEFSSQEYQNAFNRYLTGEQQDSDIQSSRRNRLASVARVGQTAVGQTGQQMQNLSNTVGQQMVNRGDAIAQGAYNAAQARNSGYAGASNAIQQGAQNYLSSGSSIASLFGGGSGSNSSTPDLGGK
jgi:hypothetical protein